MHDSPQQCSGCLIVIHSTAVVDPKANIGPDVEIGPYCVVGPHVTLGAGARLMSHVVIDGRTTIGARCTIFPFASIGSQTQDLKFKGDVTFVEVGEQTTLREYVTVNSGTKEGEVTRVGARCHIMAYCHVAHACRVGDDVIMANCATLAGEVVVEDQAVIGGLTGVHQFTRIGRLAMIGGCSRITQDCPPFMMIEGNPAEVRGLNSLGLERRGVGAEARKKLKECYRLMYRSELSTAQATERIVAEQGGFPEVEHLVTFIKATTRGIIK